MVEPMDAQRIARHIAAEVEAHPDGALADAMTDLVAKVVEIVAFYETHAEVSR